MDAMRNYTDWPQIQRYDNPNAASVTFDNIWAYCLYEYSDYGPPVKISSYTADGRLTGYCYFDWLLLAPDGTTTEISHPGSAADLAVE